MTLNLFFLPTVWMDASNFILKCIVVIDFKIKWIWFSDFSVAFASV